MPDSEKKTLTAGFDPFNDRPSRTIRNALSEMLRDSLARREPFTADVVGLLRRYPQPPYIEYVRGRVDRYRAATREAMSAGASTLAQAAILWRHHLYFEAHEVLEPRWQNASGKEREGLQGLIQAAGVYVHLEAGHDQAAKRLARKACDRLRQFGDAIGDTAPIKLEALIARLEDLIAGEDNSGK